MLSISDRFVFVFVDIIIFCSFCCKLIRQNVCTFTAHLKQKSLNEKYILLWSPDHQDHLEHIDHPDFGGPGNLGSLGGLVILGDLGGLGGLDSLGDLSVLVI